ncbi:MAG: hypothetical protein JST38_02190, partial [Bacteroidetes bacterium]|nr:hypothetical protein [Bacteroidota bacterium]
MSPSLPNPNAALRTWWQRTLLVLLILAGGFTFSAKAQTVTIGSGTGTSSYLPLYNYYGYNYTQQIYTAAQVTQGGIIDKIRFKLNAGSLTNSTDWRVFMGNTAKTAFSSNTDWVPTSGMTQVYNGTVPAAPPLGTWMEITLQTPFTYNGTDNLVIAVNEYTPGYGSSSTNWSAFTSGANTGIYYYEDTNNPNPNSPPTASNRSGTIPQIQINFLPSCTGTPVAGTLPANTPTCVGSSLTLSPTGGTVAANLTYLWEQSTDGGATWANAGGTYTNATYTTAPYSAPISYRRTTTCTTSNSTATTNVAAISLMGAPPYFAFVDSYTQSFESWSNRCSTTDVPSLNWLNTPATTDSSWRRNDQGASASWTSPGSTAYSPLSTDGTYSARFHSLGSTGKSGRLDFYVDLSAATGNTKLKFDWINTSGSDVLQVRISTDGGTTFSDLGAVLGQSGSGWNTATEYTITSNSPTTVIRFKATSDLSTTDIGLDNVRLFTPCTGTPAAAVATATPSSVCAGNTAVITATGTGNPVTGISFQWEQSNDGSTGWVAIPSATATTYTTPALTADRYFRLKQACSYSGSQSYSNVVGVTQAATPYAAYNNVSFTEDFESWASACSTTDVPSLNWRNTPYSGNNSWRRDDQGSTASWTNISTGAYTPAGSNSSAHSARFHSNATSGSQGSLDLYLDMSTATGPSRLTFDYINTSGTDVLGVWVSTSGGAAGTFQQIGSNLGVATAWGSKTFDFSSTSATTVVRLLATSDAGSTDIGLDNFKIAPAPSCLPPFNLAAIGATATTGSLSWTASLSAPANGYLWEVRTTGLPGNPGSAAANGSTAAGVTNATATGLAAST